ncbi:MAG: PEGA domain-containing protein [Deltaproteobacteria bacterium]|nr:PEGA domain-containing protein [Deltaproteobacteria bacterium]
MKAKKAPLKSAVGSLLGMVVVSAMVGCATLISGTTQKFGLSTTPAGASVTVDNQTRGQTPVVLKLDRGADHTLKITLPGYKPFETTITRKMNGWFWGNLAFGGLVGIIVDVSNGAMYKLKTEEHVALYREDFGSEKDVLTIATVLHPDPLWEQVGSLVPSEPAAPPIATTASVPTSPPQTPEPPVAPETPVVARAGLVPETPVVVAVQTVSYQDPRVIPLNSSAGIIMPMR